MLFTDFTAKISELQSTKLGGKDSLFKLAPKVRKDFPDELINLKKPREAAVLVLFYPNIDNETYFILTERASYKGTHSAQISFTGGKSEKNETQKQTALRETYEEIGVPPKEIKIIRPLTETYIPPSNFLVKPFLGYTSNLPEFKPNYEVEKLIEVSITDLLDEKNMLSKKIETSYMESTDVPYFNLNGHIVWGATAMILSEIKDLFLAL